MNQNGECHERHERHAKQRAKVLDIVTSEPQLDTRAASQDTRKALQR